MALVALSALPSSAVVAASDISPFVISGTTKKMTQGAYRTAMFAFAQSDPLNTGSLTAVGNSTITGTLSGITTLTATTGVFTNLTIPVGSPTQSNIRTVGDLTAPSLIVTNTLAGALVDFNSGVTNATTFMTISINSSAKQAIFGTDATGSINAGFVGSLSNHAFTLRANNTNWVQLGATGTLTMLATVSKLVPGATSFSHRNNADNADNLLIVDNGNSTFRAAVVIGTNLSFTSATAKILKGATSLSIRDNSDTTDLLLFNATGITAGQIIITPASLVGGAGLRIPHGTAPTSPVDGDMWSTTAGAFIRINGVTKTFTLT